MGWAGKKACWVKVLAAETDNLNSVPGTQLVEWEDSFPQVVYWPSQGHYGVCLIPLVTYIHTHACAHMETDTLSKFLM